MLNRKPAASSKPSAKSAAAVSPIVLPDNNPVWENRQFDFSCAAGFRIDGRRINLAVRVAEAPDREFSRHAES
jgi:hypothetical protein